MDSRTQQSINHVVNPHSTAVSNQKLQPSQSSDLEKRLDDSSTDVARTAGESEYEYITGVGLLLTVSSLTLVCFLMALDMSVIAAAIPHITSKFHSLGDVGWYGSAYLLSNSAVQPLTGRLYSNFGSKLTFLTFLAVFELGSLLCGVAQSSEMLIVGRAVAGLGASGLTNGALTILAAALPMHKRPRKFLLVFIPACNTAANLLIFSAIMAIIMGVSQLGTVGGPLIGGVLTQYVSWRWCFYINLPIGALCAVLLVAIKIPDHLEHSRKKKDTIFSKLSQLDCVGFLMFAPCAIMFLIALEWGGTTHPWDSATIIGLFCGAGVIFIPFILWELHMGDKAMFPYSMMRIRVVWSTCLATSFFFGCMLTTSYYLPIYFQAVKGKSPTISGVYMLPTILSQMLMAIVAGVLVSKLGYYLPWIATSGVIVSIGSGLLSLLAPQTSTGKWVGFQVLTGFGRGLGLTIPFVSIQNILPPDQIPVGMSLVSFCQTMGGAMFLAFAQTIFSRGLVEGLKKFAPTVDAQSVIVAGASAFRQVVQPEQLEGVLQAYSLGIDRIFYLAAAGSVATFVFCWGMGWYSVKKKDVDGQESEKDETT